MLWRNDFLTRQKYVKFEMHFEVDTALIGGMKIRIGDRVVDSICQQQIRKTHPRFDKNTIESR